ncbi:MAG TPA: FeoB small GTPase domain-containing protein [Myxococcota bacterium]|nr:FeoB small GTPase domain-containing protein [Myxococcota bacterium]HRY93884.1 FeoB small GTPase domain-containing protein [Myxococcota bacterium]
MLLLGQLKVGKSTLFEGLGAGRDQRRVYPPTGVEVRHRRLDAGRYDTLLDVPGCYSLLDRGEDAMVVRDLLARRRVGAAIWVLDAKNPRRGLGMVGELFACRVPLVVALNMTDEAAFRGVEFRPQSLEAALGVPVVPVVASEGSGLAALRRRLPEARPLAEGVVSPEAPLAGLLSGLEGLLAGHPFSAPALAFLLLHGAQGARDVLEDHAEAELCARVEAALRSAAGALGRPAELWTQEASLAAAERIAAAAFTLRPSNRGAWARRLAAWTRRPGTGLPIAVLVLACMYAFVGWFGAGVLVDLLEGRLFGDLVLPALQGWTARIPWESVRELLVGPFGLVSVGLVLPLGLVLPVLATFFFAFGLLEDSGYVARMSLLFDRGLRKVGLNGKAVLPLVMGFSCVTMAVLATRILETRRQRLLAALLLTLAFPCAPLLGVMLVVLGRLPALAGVLLVALLVLQFGLVGWAAHRLLPGGRQDLVLELPPLRLPRLRSLLALTGRRVAWFLREAIPYFLLGTLAMWALDQLGLLDGLHRALEPILAWGLGLPPESADVLLMTIIRREAGAGLLVQQMSAGLYTGAQALVCLLVMTLMVPCVNTLLVLYKERGARAATAIVAFVMVYALLVGALVSHGLRLAGVSL